MGHDFAKDVSYLPPSRHRRRRRDKANIFLSVGIIASSGEMERIRRPNRWDDGARGESTVRSILVRGATITSSSLLTQKLWHSDGAQDILDEYFKKQGGRPVKPTKGAKKRKSLGEPKEKKEKETPAKKRNKVALGSGNDSEALSTDWVPKSKSWESEVNSVDTIQRDKDGKLFAYLVFNNGKKSKVSIHMCYEKCPLKVRRNHITKLTLAMNC